MCDSGPTPRTPPRRARSRTPPSGRVEFEREFSVLDGSDSDHIPTTPTPPPPPVPLRFVLWDWGGDGDAAYAACAAAQWRAQVGQGANVGLHMVHESDRTSSNCYLHVLFETVGNV